MFPSGRFPGARITFIAFARTAGEQKRLLMLRRSTSRRREWRELPTPPAAIMESARKYLDAARTSKESRFMYVSFCAYVRDVYAMIALSDSEILCVTCL